MIVRLLPQKPSKYVCLCSAFILSWTAVLCLPDSLRAASFSELQRQGTAAYEAGSYEQALTLFNQAVAAQPTDSTAIYNQGTALYKLGRFSEARQAFAASAGTQTKQRARARSEYNQGRSLLAQAGESQDLTQKKELLLAANQAFQQALRDDPTLKAARKGIEDFRKEYAKINQQPAKSQSNQGQKQQGDQQQKDQGQESQDLQNKLNEAGQQQQDMANQSKQASADSSQSGSSQELQDMATQQQSVRQSLEKIKEELSKDQTGQNSEEQGAQDVAKQMEQAINEQKKAEEALRKGDLNQAQHHQQQAADSLQDIASDLGSDNEGKTEQSAPPAVEKENQDGEAKDAAARQQQEGEHGLQNHKPDSTVTDILDGEKALHEMRRLRLQQQRPASGKDW